MLLLLACRSVSVPHFVGILLHSFRVFVRGRCWCSEMHFLALERLSVSSRMVRLQFATVVTMQKVFVSVCETQQTRLFFNAKQDMKKHYATTSATWESVRQKIKMKKRRRSLPLCCCCCDPDKAAEVNSSLRKASRRPVWVTQPQRRRCIHILELFFCWLAFLRRSFGTGTVRKQEKRWQQTTTTTTTTASLGYVHDTYVLRENSHILTGRNHNNGMKKKTKKKRS